MEKIISNGSSNPITATDWNQMQANQKVVTQLVDGSRVSPLETVFLTPAQRVQDAILDSRVNDFSVPTNNKAIIYLGLGLLAWKLLRR